MCLEKNTTYTSPFSPPLTNDAHQARMHADWNRYVRSAVILLRSLATARQLGIERLILCISNEKQTEVSPLPGPYTPA